MFPKVKNLYVLTQNVRYFPYICWFSGCLSVYLALACGCHPILYIIVFLKPSSLLFPFWFGKNNGVFKLTLPLGGLMILHISAHETVSCKIIDVTNSVYILYRAYFYWLKKSHFCVLGFKLNSSLILIDQEEPVYFEFQHTEMTFRNQ